MSDDHITPQEARRQKLRRLKDFNYPNRFRPDSRAGLLAADYQGHTREQLETAAVAVKIAGRIMLRRVMGKALFLTVQDMSGRMQIYANEKLLGEAAFATIADLDGGDIIGCEGVLFKTRSGELTVRARTVSLLAKALQPPPEKFHGLGDIEARYRRRHISLAADPDEREVFIRRAKIVRSIREFFQERGYWEMETPILQPIPGGAAARPFVARCDALDRDFYLRIAQELYLKRLLVGGFERVFELNRNFRNEGVSTRHNPEFTMLEFNAAYRTAEDFMDLTEELLHQLATNIGGGEVLPYQGREINFKRPFARLSPAEAVRRAHPHWTAAQLDDESFLRRQLAEYPTGGGGKNAGIGELQLLLFEHTAEHTLINPTFIVDYPAACSPLARRRDDRPDIAERFELFAAGRELVNGFSELNDPRLQAEIFALQAKKKSDGDDEAMHFDADYIHALECGLPPNAGGGIGIDRLVMLLTDKASIREVILFPQLRAAGDK